MMCALGARAYTFQTGGIYYNVTSSSSKTVEVTYMDASYYSLGAYDGNITIPGTVTYNGYIYTVTRIRQHVPPDDHLQLVLLHDET